MFQYAFLFQIWNFSPLFIMYTFSFLGASFPIFIYYLTNTCSFLTTLLYVFSFLQLFHVNDVFLCAYFPFPCFFLQFPLKTSSFHFIKRKHALPFFQHLPLVTLAILSLFLFIMSFIFYTILLILLFFYLFLKLNQWIALFPFCSFPLVLKSCAVALLFIFVLRQHV